MSRNTESNNKSENNYQRNAVEIPDAVNITALKTVISRYEMYFSSAVCLQNIFI